MLTLGELLDETIIPSTLLELLLEKNLSDAQVKIQIQMQSASIWICVLILLFKFLISAVLPARAAHWARPQAALLTVR